MAHVEGKKELGNSDHSANSSAVSDSRKSESDLHLVGSSYLTVQGLVEETLSAGAVPSSGKMRKIADEFDAEVRKHLNEIANLNPVFITGHAALTKVLEQDPRLRELPLVNMAPDTFVLKYQTERLAEQVSEVLNPETVEWHAPVHVVESSRRVFHGFKGNTRAGTVGRGQPRDAAINESVRVFGDLAQRGILLADDRGSEQCSSLVELAQEYLARGIEVRGFIVGHAARPKYRNAEGLADDVPVVQGNRRTLEIPLYAHTYRYLNPSEQSLKRGAPAAEYCELGYYQAAGYSIMKGYLEAYPFLQPAYRALQDILREEQQIYSSKDFTALEEAGVEIVHKEELARLLGQCAAGGRRLNLEDLCALFGKRQGRSILELKEAREFNPNEMDCRRAPVLWPGIPEETSFLRVLTSKEHTTDYRKWYEFSKRMLQTTLQHLESIKEITGGRHVPKTVLGFMGIPKIMERFSPKTRQSADAIDYINELLDIIEEEQRMRALGSSVCYFKSDTGLKAETVENGDGDPKHPTLKRWY